MKYLTIKTKLIILVIILATAFTIYSLNEIVSINKQLKKVRHSHGIEMPIAYKGQVHDSLGNDEVLKLSGVNSQLHQIDIDGINHRVFWPSNMDYLFFQSE